MRNFIEHSVVCYPLTSIVSNNAFITNKMLALIFPELQVHIEIYMYIHVDVKKYSAGIEAVTSCYS